MSDGLTILALYDRNGLDKAPDGGCQSPLDYLQTRRRALGQNYTVTLSGEDLLSLAETLLFLYGFVKMNSTDPSIQPPEAMLYTGWGNSLKSVMKTLLKGPLKDAHFRETFNEYFDTHPMGPIKQLTEQYLDELVTWESP